MAKNEENTCPEINGDESSIKLYYGSVKEAGEFSLNPNQSKEQKNAFSGNKSILIKLFVMIMLIIVLA